jgi:hypothetical protein
MANTVAPLLPYTVKICVQYPRTAVTYGALSQDPIFCFTFIVHYFLFGLLMDIACFANRKTCFCNIEHWIPPWEGTDGFVDFAVPMQPIVSR